MTAVRDTRGHWSSRLLAASAVVGVLLPGIGTAQTISPPYGLPDKGALRLQLGATTVGAHQPRRWVYQDSASGGSLGASETITGKCDYSETGMDLAQLTATGGLGRVGVGPDSIGVADGPRGVACYRVSGAEALEVGLGAYTRGMPPVTPGLGANAFYRLELDIEAKSNAEFKLEILRGTAVAETYYMRTGSSIVAGEGSSVPNTAQSATEKIFNCLAPKAADSGSDSGSGDNCRWYINELGTSFRLSVVSGEGSLEGGGDYGAAAYGNNSIIYLTQATIGSLACNSSTVPGPEFTPTISGTAADATCAVTRIDPSNVGGQCTMPVGYVFRNVGGTNRGCELIKSPGEQFAASVEITFPPETRTELTGVLSTSVLFSDGEGGYVPFEPKLCKGTVVDDPNGNPTIAEVLATPTPAFVTDVVSGAPIDWACILEQTVEYIGPKDDPSTSSVNESKMIVRQKILFWGDISWTRF